RHRRRSQPRGVEKRMILAKVKGEVVATIRHPAYENRRMLLLDKIDAEGRELGGYLVAIDCTSGAGVGQTVLVIDEGNSARQIISDIEAPIRSVIIGVVDEITVA
ncbi:MAG: EutN/CcmL family microcompartment protein, partial [Phycisphaerae bacterium]|nr:EutN/CcmL family microcompartment protein [Phycisphaerae bacterium]